MKESRQTNVPVVSVVMPTYNGEQFLRPAIESILDQTFRDFELIVIDDGSDDDTPRICAEFHDDRFVVLTNERNLGIAAATNRGLSLARGEYVALQDHDDISLPNRLQAQVEYLDGHPEIALIGSAATLIDKNGVAYGEFPQPCEEINLKWELLWSCPIHHTSVMFRRSAILEIGGYTEAPELQFAEGWEPLARIAMRHGIANLPDRLVLWRRHAGATSIQHRQRAQASCEATVLRNLYRLAGGNNGLEPPDVGSNHKYRYAGLKAFLYTPGGQLPDLPAEQVTAGARLLCDVQDSFYRINKFSPWLVARHRKPLNWCWGKHAVALAIRAPWGLFSRTRMLSLGIASLRYATWAALLSGVAALRPGTMPTRH